MVLVGLTGNFIEFGSAVFIGGDVYQGRSFSHKLCLDFHGHENVLRLTKAFQAVRLATESIQDFHESMRRRLALKDSIDHYFPSPTPLDDAPLPALSFKCRLSPTGRRYVHPRNLEEVRSALYIATLQAPASSDAVEPLRNVEVVVKFAPRYGAEAHRLLAEKGLAPTLHACRKVLGDFYMIVMDYVPGETAESLIDSRTRIPAPVWDDVKTAIDILHEKDLVFGDLRLPKIMCVPTEFGDSMRAKLVGFDWAGTHGQDRYPTTMGAEFRQWAPGMHRYEVMLKRHDLAMLRRLPVPSE